MFAYLIGAFFWILSMFINDKDYAIIGTLFYILGSLSSIEVAIKRRG